jgi:hypothetical protein
MRTFWIAAGCAIINESYLLRRLFGGERGPWLWMSVVGFAASCAWVVIVTTELHGGHDLR